MRVPGTAGSRNAERSSFCNDSSKRAGTPASPTGRWANSEPSVTMERRTWPPGQEWQAGPRPRSGRVRAQGRCGREPAQRYRSVSVHSGFFQCRRQLRAIL